MSRGWASDFQRRAEAAQRTWDLQKARRDVRRLQGTVAALEADAADAVDIGEGTGVDVRSMIKQLQVKDEQARAEVRHRGAQRVARGLGDGSELAEQDGTRLFRMRTEARVPVPAAAPASKKS